MKKINIIGGNGFIGTRLVGRLKKHDGCSVKIIDKAPSGTFPDIAEMGDVRSIEQLSRTIENDSVIVYLAAEHRDDVHPRELYDQVNVQGAANLCAVAEQKNVRKIIFTSSVAVYGFAPIGADGVCAINPFNDYGRTKYLAEEVFKAWQAKEPEVRELVIIRPTVVFGERNRGNVYNLLKQIASGRFLMVGRGLNRKSIAYVENVVAFIEYCLDLGHGVHVFNYADKPDLNMNELVRKINETLGKKAALGLRIPYGVGLCIGMLFDGLASLTRRKFAISAIRVKKFCSDSVYSSAVERTGFKPPVALSDALCNTIRYEFMEDHTGETLFYSE